MGRDGGIGWGTEVGEWDEIWVESSEEERGDEVAEVGGEVESLGSGKDGAERVGVGDDVMFGGAGGEDGEVNVDVGEM